MNQDQLVLYQKDGLELKVSNAPSTEGLILLKNTIYGTNGPKYRHLTVDKVLPLMPDPHFIDLRYKGKLAATYCYSRRLVEMEGKTYVAWYRRYLSVDPVFMGKGLGKLIAEESFKYFSSLEKDVLFYGYVDEHNIRSMNISRHLGFEPLSEFRNLIFSRFNPKAYNYVEVKSATDEEIKLLLKNFYKDHLLYRSPDTGGNYFVIKENNKIVAGVQANVVGWQFENVGGWQGEKITSFLKFLPLKSILFNPENHSFAAFEAIFVEKDGEEKLWQLFETVLFLLKVKSAMVFLDPEDKLYNRLNKRVKLGFLNKLNGSGSVYLTTFLQGDAVIFKEEFGRKPIYVSASDLT